MVKTKEFRITTDKRCCWSDVTQTVESFVKESGIRTGSVTVTSLHTTAGITVNENADPDVGRDFFSILDSLVPRLNSYAHAEGNSDSHVKASLTGISEVLPVAESRIVLGTWQSIYFCEYDGPRTRKIRVVVNGS